MKGMGFVNELNISKNVFISFNCNVKGGRVFDIGKDDIEGDDDDDDFDVGVVGILVVSLLLLERLSLFISSSKKSEIDSKNKSNDSDRNRKHKSGIIVRRGIIGSRNKTIDTGCFIRRKF
jgi:hypothetical protein